MKTIQLNLSFSDELELKNIIFQDNDTGFNSDKGFLKWIAQGIIDSIECDELTNEAKELLNK